MAINVFTSRITTKRVHLFSSLAQFSLIASFCLFLQKHTGLHVIFLFLYIYIYKFEIRNSEIYLPEVSVSSTMGKRHSDVTKSHSDRLGLIINPNKRALGH